MVYIQTYDSYFKDYFKSPNGRAARLKAQKKWRAKKRLEASKTPQISSKHD